MTQKLEDELKVCKYELFAANETIKSLKSEIMILEQNLSALEKRNAGEVAQKNLKFLLKEKIINFS